MDLQDQRRTDKSVDARTLVTGIFSQELTDIYL